MALLAPCHRNTFGQVGRYIDVSDLLVVQEQLMILILLSAQGELFGQKSSQTSYNPNT